MVDALYIGVDLPVLVFGYFGGLGMNLIRLGEIANQPKAERLDVFDLMYWLQFMLSPLVGAVLAYAYQRSGAELTPIVAINIGASAPLILKSFAAATPSPTRPKVD